MKDREEKIIIDTFEEQETKEIRPIIRNQFDKLIKQNVLKNKPKIIRDILKDKIMKDIFDTKTKKEKKRKKNEYRIIRDIRKLFDIRKKRKKKQDERLIKDGTIRDNYVEYESNGDKNKNLPLDEYLNKIQTYLRNMENSVTNCNKLYFFKKY